MLKISGHFTIQEEPEIYLSLRTFINETVNITLLFRKYIKERVIVLVDFGFPHIYVF